VAPVGPVAPVKPTPTNTKINGKLLAKLLVPVPSELSSITGTSIYEFVCIIIADVIVQR
jgi:hypothetical protein